MNWTPDNVNSGEVVAAQTTSGNFKDVSVLTVYDGMWSTVSLRDGLQSDRVTLPVLLKRLNEHGFVPCAKVYAGTAGQHTLPENRAGLPVVVIHGMRDAA